MFSKSLLFPVFVVVFLTQGQVEAQQHYSLRKYAHVQQFYKGIAKEATKICLDNNIPPASLLAIAALESGWNEGYIGKITGNILSLNINKKDRQLPQLYLPTHLKTNTVIFDSLALKTYTPSELVWKQRNASYKKDYRPKPWRGTIYNLGYFENHPKEKKKAHLKNISDFVTTFIGRNSTIKAYRVARKQMDSLVSLHGKSILLEEQTAIAFINAIGGKPNSYNFRKTWPIKVTNIMSKVGLVALTKQLHQGERFEVAWKH